MTYLIDANVLSEPTKPAPNPTVVDWLTINEGDFVVDSVVLGELCIGVLLLPAGRKRTQLQQWLDAVVQTIECLPWDAAVSRRWTKLVVELRSTGRTLPVLDSMIAATALEHGLTVATRNIRDFRKTGVKVVDPFA
ncbi:MAG: type II toxin-antitoxin system VapC family toxin [Candidatus Binatia bacterium]